MIGQRRMLVRMTSAAKAALRRTSRSSSAWAARCSADSEAGSAPHPAISWTNPWTCTRLVFDLTSTLHFPALGALSAPAPSGEVVSVIPTGVWQAARSLGDYTLVGCTVGPGFEFADFEFVSALPSHRDHFVGELAHAAGYA